MLLVKKSCLHALYQRHPVIPLRHTASYPVGIYERAHDSHVDTAEKKKKKKKKTFEIFSCRRPLLYIFRCTYHSNAIILGSGILYFHLLHCTLCAFIICRDLGSFAGWLIEWRMRRELTFWSRRGWESTLCNHRFIRRVQQRTGPVHDAQGGRGLRRAGTASQAIDHSQEYLDQIPVPLDIPSYS
jgi:hypothetical protein